MTPEPISTTMAMTGAVGLGAAIGVSMIDTASMSVFGVPAIVPFFAFLGAAAREIGDNMRVDATFSLGAEEMYGLSYLLEGFQKSVDVLLDSKGRRAA